MACTSLEEYEKACEGNMRSIFREQKWTNYHDKLYRLFEYYLENYRTHQMQYCSREDIKMIRLRLNDQLWFQKSKVKLILTGYLDRLKIKHYYLNKRPETTEDVGATVKVAGAPDLYIHNHIDFQLQLDFGRFQVFVNYLAHADSHLVNFYIYFCDPKNATIGYLTCYTRASGLDPNNARKNLKMPDFSKIYKVLDTTDQILPQFELLSFFSEIIFYYDEYKAIGNCPIAHAVPIVSLNQLIEKYNTYAKEK